MSLKKLTHIAMLTAMAIILHIAENLIPLSLPMGIKLGFANVITLIALILMDFKSALIIVALRTFLGSLFSGTFLSVTFLMSFGGGMAAALIMFLLFRSFKNLSPVGISIGGAVAHNITQLLLASLFAGSLAIFYYLPVLLIASIPTGILTGFLAEFTSSRIKNLLPF